MIVSVQAIDDFGNDELGGLAISPFLLSSGSSSKGTFGKVTYAGNGIYRATFTATEVGQAIIEAVIARVKSHIHCNVNHVTPS